MTTQHKFELAGLGQAPYRLEGVRENLFTVPGGPSKPGGTCDYCSTAITFEFHLCSADGKKFKVGCDCVLKVESSRSLIDQVKQESNRLKAKARHAKEDAKISALTEWYAANREAVASHPHPQAEKFNEQARKELNLASYVDFCLKCAGRSGTIAALSLAKKIIESK